MYEIYKKTKPALSMKAAFEQAAAVLHKDEREIRRGWKKYWEVEGCQFVPPWEMRGHPPRRSRRK